MLLLFDFSPYSKGYARQRSMGDAMGGVQCLHIVVYGLTENDKEQACYFDFFTTDNNDGVCFRNIMMTFLKMDQMKDKIIRYYWSDGGPMHFKTRNSILFLIIEVPNTLRWVHAPEWHFFCPQHGKSACDGRAATVKGFLKRLAIKGVQTYGAEGIVKAISSDHIAKLSSRNAFLSKIDAEGQA